MTRKAVVRPMAAEAARTTGAVPAEPRTGHRRPSRRVATEVRNTGGAAPTCETPGVKTSRAARESAPGTESAGATSAESCCAASTMETASTTAVKASAPTAAAPMESTAVMLGECGGAAQEKGNRGAESPERGSGAEKTCRVHRFTPMPVA